jgi:GABA permease
MLFVYMLIAIAQLRLRSRLEIEAPERLQLRMWLHPYGTWAAILGMGGILILMAFSKSRVELWASVIVTSLFAIAYVVRRAAAPNAEPRGAA